MPKSRRSAPGDGGATPFARWLDSMVPAKFPTDAAFAREVGVPRDYIFQWRRGRVPQTPLLLKIARATGTSVETLVELAGYEPPAVPGQDDGS